MEGAAMNSIATAVSYKGVRKLTPKERETAKAIKRIMLGETEKKGRKNTKKISTRL